jgi:hypothetical protein
VLDRSAVLGSPAFDVESHGSEGSERE